MQKASSFRRSVLLTFSLLSACAASDISGPTVAQVATSRPNPPKAGASGAFLAGRFAATEGDLTYASTEFLKALALDPGEPELVQQAFLATLLDNNRTEALRLARQQQDNPAAQLLVAGNDASTGNWEQAENRFANLPKQGLTQVLQPLLVAWAQQGAGRTDAALATLKPFVEGQRFRAVYALHAAMIADLAGRVADAARLYRTAQVEFGNYNLQLARALASWDARQGHPDEAQAVIKALVEQSDDLKIAAPALQAAVNQRVVRRPTDGIAEAYLALAAALHAQDANEFAIVLTRLALDLRPDFTSARMLAAEITDGAGGGRRPADQRRAASPRGAHRAARQHRRRATAARSTGPPVSRPAGAAHAEGRYPALEAAFRGRGHGL
jgi:tetratricopeptide (TPR) repeat protein